MLQIDSFVLSFPWSTLETDVEVDEVSARFLLRIGFVERPETILAVLYLHNWLRSLAAPADDRTPTRSYSDTHPLNAKSPLACPISRFAKHWQKSVGPPSWNLVSL